RCRFDSRVGTLEAVELALVVERLLRAQRAPQHVDELARAAVAVALLAEVAVAALIGLTASGDVVDRDAPPAGEVVEGRELACDKSRRDETGTMRDEYLQLVGRVQGGRSDREA